MDFLRNNRLALHLMIGILLTIIYPMQGLFSGNQNIYFLWGMSELLPGTFAADPLLHSPDPYPLFSWLISIFPVQFIAVWTTLLYVLLNSVYSFALFGIADQVSDIYRYRSSLFSLTALFLFLHCSPIWGTYIKSVADVDLRWMWDSGIAEQGMLRGYLQPSVFGVFLLLSFYFAARRNFTAAILSIAPAATIHANYLFLGGILTVIYLLQARSVKKTIIASGVLFMVVLPYTVYLLKHFLLLGPEAQTFINAAVSETFDTNLHLNPKNWVNAKLPIQFTVLFLGFFAFRKSHIRKLYFSILTISVALTATAYVLESTILISLNPWRFSVLLVPVSVAAIVSRLTSSNTWNMLKPVGVGLAGSVCTMFVCYRVFGNPSQDFHHVWLLMHGVISLSLILISIWLSRYEFFEKKFNFLLVTVLVTVGLTDLWIEQRSKAAKEEFQAIEKLKGTEPNTVYIIPPDWTSFRMNAQKAVFVDENLVYGSALPALMNRLDLVKTHQYHGILASIPSGTTTKLIAPNSSHIPEFISSQRLTDNYTCYVLRQ